MFLEADLDRISNSCDKGTTGKLFPYEFQINVANKGNVNMNLIFGQSNGAKIAENAKNC